MAATPFGVAVTRAVALAGALTAVGLCGPAAGAQQTPQHEFIVTAYRYAFDPPRLEVHLGDLVKITVRAADIPHSFVVDDYRIAKKARPDHEVTFEFLADKAGVFIYYCSLTAEDGCRGMRGELVVLPPSPN